MEKVIDITAKREGFCRCGIAHSETTRTYPMDFFKPAQLEELQAEPMLIVVVRNKDDAGSNHTDQLEALNSEVKKLNNDIIELTGQVSTALENNTRLTGELEAERQTVIALTAERDGERQKAADLTAELEGERQKVAELTEQLAAASKKGK